MKRCEENKFKKIYTFICSSEFSDQVKDKQKTQWNKRKSEDNVRRFWIKVGSFNKNLL